MQRGAVDYRKYEINIERLAERVYNNSAQKISDRDTFNLEFDKYMNRKLSTHQEKGLREKVFDAMRKRHTSISEEKYFTDAGGKDLRKDRTTRAKRITKDVEKYKKTGSKRIDLEGYDTPPKQNQYRYLDVTGKYYARKEHYVEYGKTRTIYRARNGRFVKVREKQ